MASADLLLHPVRLRILQTLDGPDALTTAQLRERLPDIPAATMYRHVAALANADVLEVADEKRVRGTVERSYRVRRERAVVDGAARTAMTRDDHRQAFTAFAAALLGDFHRYIDREDAMPADDGVVYRQAAMWLTDDEFAELIEKIYALVTADPGEAAGTERKRRVFSIVVVPDKET